MKPRGQQSTWQATTFVVAGMCAAAGLAVCEPATAQSNSLFGGLRRPAPSTAAVPTTQPAGGQRAADALRLGVQVRSRRAAREPDARTNAMLLGVSPIAVALPEPDVIQVHDLITIIIRESKSAKTDAQLEQKKDWTHEWELSKWIRLSDEHGLVPALFEQGIPAVQFEYKNDYGGDGKYDRKDELTTRVTGRVIDIKPNGNLVLEAKGTIVIDEEGYTVTLTGECRSEDVTPQNTVLSTQLAQRHIDIQHKGAVRDATRRGWIARLLDFARPF